MKKKILSVCGTGGVTSGVITKHVYEIAAANDIDVDIINSNAFDMKSQLDSHDFDMIITSTRLKQPSGGVPVVDCMAFLIGINEEETEKKILDILNKE